MQFASTRTVKVPRQSKYQIAVVAVLAAAILGWRFLTKSITAESDWFRVSGYWVMLALVALSSLAWLSFWKPRFPNARAWCKAHWVGLILAVGGGVFFQIHEPRQYKVLFDEFGYSGISYDMHFSRLATFPSRAHYIEARLYVLEHGLDKRPVLFPFLVSVVHDLTGYRVNNTIYLNGVIAGLFLLAIYFLAAMWHIKEGGWVAQLLLIGLPLLSQCATGGGYDLANLLFLTLFAIAATAYLRSAGVRGLDPLVCVTVMLAQLRYESVLMTLACAALVLTKWVRTKHVRLTWMSVGMIAFLFIPILINKLSMSQPTYFENREGQPLTSLGYFWGNFSHAFVYLYQFGIVETNNPWLSYLGTIAIFFAVVHGGKLLVTRQPITDDLKIILAMSAICVLNTLIMMCWFWSAWDDPMASRFSLVLIFAFVLSTIWLIKQWRLKRRVPVVAIWALGIACLSGSTPAAANSTATKNIITGAEFASFFKFLEAYPREKTLVVGPGYIGAITNQFPATPSGFVNAAPWKISRILANHHYDNIIAIQRFIVDPLTMKEGPDMLSKLSDDFVVQVIAEKRFRPDIITRFVKIVGVKPGKDIEPEEEKKKGPPYKSNYDLIFDALNKLP